MRPGDTGGRARLAGAHLTVEDDGSEEIAVYCPECDEREFGECR
jgi:hypothetical protein